MGDNLQAWSSVWHCVHSDSVAAVVCNISECASVTRYLVRLSSALSSCVEWSGCSLMTVLFASWAPVLRCTKEGCGETACLRSCRVYCTAKHRVQCDMMPLTAIALGTNAV